MFIFGLCVGLAGGGALVWFGKDKMQAMVIGANALSAKLHAKADLIANAVKK